MYKSKYYATLIMFLIFLDSCSGCKQFYSMTTILNNPECKCKLFIEDYHTILGIDTYLTDSLNFRVFIGTYNEEQGNISFECLGDSIIVEHSIRDPGYVYGGFILKKRDVYNLRDLKKAQRLE